MICIAGKNDIAVNVLRYALSIIDNTEVVACVNQCDDGTDTWQKSYLKECMSKKIRVISLEELYEADNLIFLSLEYDKLLKTDLFKSRYLYNLHFSLLPKYRGMYTSALPILNNEQESGVTLHCIDNGIDTGDIIDQISFAIKFDDTARDLYLKYIKYGTILVKSNIENLLAGKITTYSQDKLKATYYSKTSINYKDLKVDLKQPAVSVYNQIRALSFKEYQMPIVFNKKIEKCLITNDRSNKMPGTIISQDNKYMAISTMDYNVIFFLS